MSNRLQRLMHLMCTCRRTKLGLGLSALMATLMPLAPAVAQGPGWTANSTVAKLVVTAAGDINVMLSPNVVGCVSASGYGASFASIYANHPGINRMKADLLYAHATGTKVSLYLADANCTVWEMVLGGW